MTASLRLEDIRERVARLEEVLRDTGSRARMRGNWSILPTGDVIFPRGVAVGGDGQTVSGDKPSPATALVLSWGANENVVFIDATWTAPIGPASDQVAEYEAELTKLGAGVQRSETTKLTEVRFEPVEPNTEYTVRVRPITKIGRTGDYVTATITTGADTTIPGQVTGLILTAGVKSILARWTENSEIDVKNGNGAYGVQIATDAAFTLNLRTVRVSATLVSFSDLTSGTTYYIRVRAIDSSGNPGAYSSTASIAPGAITEQPHDGNVPGSSPTPTVQGGVGFLLAKWTPITNNDPVTYEVHVSTTTGFTPSGLTKAGESPGSFFFIRTLPDGSALVYGTTYYVKTVAKDLDGSAAASAEGSGTPVQVGVGDVVDRALTNLKIALGTIQGEVVAAGAITETKISDNSISSGKIIAGAVVAGKIAANAVTANEIAAGSITTAKIVAGAVTANEIAANTITGGKIAAGTITATNIAALTITASQIAANTITGDKLVVDAITAREITVGAVGSSELGTDAVTSVKISNGAIVAGKIAAGSISSDRIDTVGLAAEHIKFGTMSGDRISANTLNANRITSGTISAATIILDSTSLGILRSSNYLGGSAGWKIDGAGFAEFSGVTVRGTIHAQSGTFSGTITASGTISGGTISGATVTGGTIQTASSPGKRVSLVSSDIGTVEFWSGDGSESFKGSMSVGIKVTGSSRQGSLLIQPPTMGVGKQTASFELLSESQDGLIKERIRFLSPSSLMDSPLYIRSDTNHQLKYQSLIDGPILDGFAGAALRSGGVMEFCSANSVTSKTVTNTDSAFKDHQANTHTNMSDPQAKRNLRLVPSGMVLSRLKAASVYHFEHEDDPTTRIGLLSTEVPPELVHDMLLKETDPDGPVVLKGIGTAEAIAFLWGAARELLARVERMELIPIIKASL